MKYHVRIVGGVIGKAQAPSHLVEDLLPSRIICTTCGMVSIDLAAI